MEVTSVAAFVTTRFLPIWGVDTFGVRAPRFLFKTPAATLK